MRDDGLVPKSPGRSPTRKSPQKGLKDRNEEAGPEKPDNELDGQANDGMEAGWLAVAMTEWVVIAVLVRDMRVRFSDVNFVHLVSMQICIIRVVISSLLLIWGLLIF